MWTRLHPALQAAAIFFVLELLIANPTQQFYQWVLKQEPAMPDFIPPGVFAGIALGLVACLYFVRGDDPDWWRTFDPNKRVYEDSTFSVRNITRACHTKNQFLPIKSATFRRCRFVGPDVAIILGHEVTLDGCSFHDGGSLLPLPDKVFIVGIVVFKNCEFINCTFEKVQLMMPPPLLKQFMDSVKGAENLPKAET